MAMAARRRTAPPDSPNLVSSPEDRTHPVFSKIIRKMIEAGGSSMPLEPANPFDNPEMYPFGLCGSTY